MKRLRSRSIDFSKFNRPNIQKITVKNDGFGIELPIASSNVFFQSHVMLQQKLGCIIQDGITEGQRFALSSDLWRCASASPHCDVLITLRPQQNKQISKELVLWLHDIIKKSEPHFDIKIKHHNLTNSYGLYITANYTSLLKGAELCHLKKPIKPSYGGGMRDFTIDEAKCFQGLEIRSNFLSGMERSMIVRQMLQMIKAPSPGGFLFRPISTESPHQILVPDGGTLLVSLTSQNVIENMLPLHQPEILADLQKRWVFALFDEQPLEDIKEYFGTEIAMYFAWLGHLTTALWTPAIIGVLMFFVGGFSFLHQDKENTLFGDICFVIFALINCIWSTAYLEMWKRQQAELAFKWGTYELQTDQFLEDPRPAYKGECLKPNPVSGRLEPFYPPWKHMLIRYGVTFPLTLLCVSFLFFIMFCLLQLQDMADAVFKHSYYFKWIIYLPMIVYALIIVSGDFFYRRLAIILNDLENYRTDDEYENYLIQKIVMFQCVSAFGSLFYIAFYLNDMKRLQETLATLLITRQLTQNIIEIAVPFIIEKFKVARLTYQMTRSMSDHSLQRHVDAARKRKDTFQSTPSSELDETFSSLPDNAEGVCENEENGGGLRLRKPNGSTLLSVTSSPKRLSSNSEAFELTEAELQALMTSYSRPLDDYLEMFIQFGYVLLFSPAFPLAASCALLNNLLEIRVDAFKLCNAVQRPFGRRVKTIGAWQKAMEMMGVAGVIVNCALIGQSGLIQRMWPDMPTSVQIIFIVALEHFVLAVKAWIDTAIPDIPFWIRIETAKVEHWRREAYKRESRLISGNDDSGRASPNMNESNSANNFSTQRQNMPPPRSITDHSRFRRVRENRSCTPAGRNAHFF